TIQPKPPPHVSWKVEGTPTVSMRLSWLKILKECNSITNPSWYRVSNGCLFPRPCPFLNPFSQHLEVLQVATEVRKKLPCSILRAASAQHRLFVMNRYGAIM